MKKDQIATLKAMKAEYLLSSRDRQVFLKTEILAYLFGCLDGKVERKKLPDSNLPIENI